MTERMSGRTEGTDGSISSRIRRPMRRWRSTGSSRRRTTSCRATRRRRMKITNISTEVIVEVCRRPKMRKRASASSRSKSNSK